MIITEKIEYTDSKQSYEGVIAYNQEIDSKVPVVMIAHAYGGQSKFEEEKAIELAKLGYVGFAIDVYGKGKRAKSPEEAKSLMDHLNRNRDLLLVRLKKSLATAKSIAIGDEEKIAAIGFCFGGKCVLDLARSGIQLNGVVSFHGIFDKPNENQTKIITPILVLHGWDDPLAKPNDVTELTKELTSKGANWEIIAYGHTGHSFTNPKANMPDRGLFYSEEANTKSWKRMSQFLLDIFKD